MAGDPDLVHVKRVHKCGGTDQTLAVGRLSGLEARNGARDAYTYPKPKIRNKEPGTPE